MVMRGLRARIFLSSGESTEHRELHFLLEDVGERQVDALQVAVPLRLLHDSREVGVDPRFLLQFQHELRHLLLRLHDYNPFKRHLLSKSATLFR